MKKIALLLVTLFSMTVFFTPTVSADMLFTYEETFQTLRYDQISSLMSITEINNDTITSSGSYSVRLNNPYIVLTIILEESFNCSDWHEAETWTFYRTTKNGSSSETYSAENRCYYRTLVILDLYDSNKNYIESAEAYSEIQFNP